MDLTTKDIHLSLLSQYKLPAMKFLQNNKLRKQLMYNEDAIEVVIKTDEKDAEYIEEICEEITDLIIDIIKYKILKEYVLKHYSDTYENEKEDIYIHSLNLFNEKELFIRDTVLSRVCDYVLKNDYLNLDGFVKFRMKEFMNFIPALGDMALEEYLMQKDQDEFISVLKYFIEIQEEKIDLLRVHIRNDNSFMLYDKDGNKINSIDDEEIINMVIKENLNYEDFLISTLLTLCPKKIEILDSLKDNCSKEIIETIKSIFGNRASEIRPN